MRSVEVRARFPADPASASRARRFLDQTLRGWQCEHLVDVATLLASELVANAILHTGSSIEVVARINQRLRIEVYDDNPRMPVRKHYSRMSATGRGLLLVERLAEDWGADATQAGKRVWFELDQSRAVEPEEVQVAAFGDFDLEELTTADWGGPAEDERGGSGGGPRLQVLVRARR